MRIVKETPFINTHKLETFSIDTSSENVIAIMFQIFSSFDTFKTEKDSLVFFMFCI